MSSEIYWISGNTIKEKSHIQIKNIFDIILGQTEKNFKKNEKHIPQNSANISATILYTDYSKNK